MELSGSFWNRIRTVNFSIFFSHFTSLSPFNCYKILCWAVDGRNHNVGSSFTIRLVERRQARHWFIYKLCGIFSTVTRTPCDFFSSTIFLLLSKRKDPLSLFNDSSHCAVYGVRFKSGWFVIKLAEFSIIK